jgi:diguanylate cyclase (GGDEF)-like protein/PAS domain S-box-containing protein
VVRELRASDEWLGALYVLIACGVVVRGAAGEIVYANPAAEELLGLPAGELRGQQPDRLWTTTDEAGEALSPAEQPDTLVLRTGRPVRKRTLGIVRPDGTRGWLEVDSVPVFGPNGRLAQVVSSYVDVTTRKQAEEALEHQAIHDPLTGLPNRTLLLDRVAQAVLASRRQHTPVALLVMNLDGFKEVNDGFGYQGGDAVLQEISERLKSVLRASDTVARIGGDEFGLLLPVVDMDGAAVLAGKVLRLLEEPVVVQGQTIDLHASLGIALCPEHGDEGETLLRRADVAMHVAKRDGSGYTVYTFEQEQHTTGRLALASDLRRAIEHDQLVLYYQPKVDYATSHVTSVEALVRWRHPQLGLVPPDQFISLAEQTGLIGPLSRWVLNAALQQCQAWRDAGLQIPVAVNISMRNIQDSQLPALITALLETWKVHPDWLTVELTESMVMADPGRAMETLGALRTMGVRIAIDDFGTGYSSLGYLKRLPVHQIKIDKSFVMDMAADENDLAIVRSTIDLGHNLGLTVVAEGVENETTWEMLARLGCDGAQGYWLSRPLPEPDLMRRLSESPWRVQQIGALPSPNLGRL